MAAEFFRQFIVADADPPDAVESKVLFQEPRDRSLAPEDLQTDENGMLKGGACSMTAQSPIGGAWYMLFAGLFLGLVPLRRRMRQ